jgi:Holliday junction DNA helicase RuvA
MIGRLTGTYSGTTPEGSALVDVGGVGYAVRLPAQATLPLREGEHVMFFIHTAVRDDAIDLYGFLEEMELVFFKQLMQVSGIGPKTALTIMGTADVVGLKRAIAAGDSGALVKVYGVGKKSAERLVVELRDKVALEAGTSGSQGYGGDDGEVIEALMALGYRADESRRALKDIAPDIVGTKARLSATLRYLGK